MEGSAGRCVIDGYTKENNGFYVLLREKKKLKNVVPDIFKKDGKINYSDYKIIAQGYAWVSNLGNLTFDSWERIETKSDKVAIKLLKQFAKYVVNDTDLNIDRVTLGYLWNNYSFLNSVAKVKLPEYIKDGYWHNEANTQLLLYESEILRARSKKLEKLLKEKHNGIFEKFSADLIRHSTQLENLETFLSNNEEKLSQYQNSPELASKAFKAIKIILHANLGFVGFKNFDIFFENGFKGLNTIINNEKIYEQHRYLYIHYYTIENFKGLEKREISTVISTNCKLSKFGISLESLNEIYNEEGYDRFMEMTSMVPSARIKTVISKVLEIKRAGISLEGLNEIYNKESYDRFMKIPLTDFDILTNKNALYLYVARTIIENKDIIKYAYIQYMPQVLKDYLDESINYKENFIKYVDNSYFFVASHFALNMALMYSIRIDVGGMKEKLKLPVFNSTAFMIRERLKYHALERYKSYNENADGGINNIHDFIKKCSVIMIKETSIAIFEGKLLSLITGEHFSIIFNLNIATNTLNTTLQCLELYNSNFNDQDDISYSNDYDHILKNFLYPGMFVATWYGLYKFISLPQTTLYSYYGGVQKVFISLSMAMLALKTLKLVISPVANQTKEKINDIYGVFFSTENHELDNEDDGLNSDDIDNNPLLSEWSETSHVCIANEE